MRKGALSQIRFDKKAESSVAKNLAASTITKILLPIAMLGFYLISQTRLREPYLDSTTGAHPRSLWGARREGGRQGPGRLGLLAGFRLLYKGFWFLSRGPLKRIWDHVEAILALQRVRALLEGSFKEGMGPYSGYMRLIWGTSLWAERREV